MNKKRRNQFRIMVYLDQTTNYLIKSNLLNNSKSSILSKIIVSHVKGKKPFCDSFGFGGGKLCTSFQIYVEPFIFNYIEKRRGDMKRSAVVRYIIRNHYNL